jgi:hypothetical protein
MDEQDMASQSQPVLPPKSGTPAAAPAGSERRTLGLLGRLSAEQKAYAYNCECDDTLVPAALSTPA